MKTLGMIAVVALALTGCAGPTPAQQAEEARIEAGPRLDAVGPSAGNNASIYADSETGCQYYANYNGGFLERRDGKGKHLGCKEI